MKKFVTRALVALGITVGLVLGTGVIAAAAAPLSPFVITASIEDLEIVIPVAPLGVTAIVAVLSTYAISFLNGILPFVVQNWQKQVLSVVVAVLLAAGGLVGYYLLSGAPWPSTAGEWFGFGLVALGVSQTSYNLVTKNLGARQAEIAAERLSA